MTNRRQSFNNTPIPHRAKNGDPMTYFVVDEDGNHTSVTREECLARHETPDGQPAQRWFVDEESGLVIRLPRTEKSEELTRENMRSVWREAKHQERWAARTVATTVNDDGDETVFEPVDCSKDADVVGILEEKALLDTLNTALATVLTKEQRDLILAIFRDGKTERQLAAELGLKEPKSVNKRKYRVLEILRQHEALRDFFK